jgi:biotin operon repressor
MYGSVTAGVVPGQGGAGKWTRGHSKFLRARDVAVIRHNDPTGAEHGLAVAKALRRVAASVRFMQLAGLPPKGDVSDWLDAGHTAAELSQLATTTPLHRTGRVRLQLPKLSRGEQEFRDLEALIAAESKRRTIYGLPIAPTEKLLLVLLAERGNPSQETLANYLGVSDRRVRQMVRHLCNTGWLTTRKSGRQLLYEVITSRRAS